MGLFRWQPIFLAKTVRLIVEDQRIVEDQLLPKSSCHLACYGFHPRIPLQQSIMVGSQTQGLLEESKYGHPVAWLELG